MIERKQKKCKKGSGKAIGFTGCGELLPSSMYNKSNFKYGLGISCGCYGSWLNSTNEGQETLRKSIIYGKKRADKEQKKEYRAKKEAVRNKSYYEKKLQALINSIVRIIDFDKGCISCDHGWQTPWTRQKHAGHRLSIGSNPQLRYNLNNIFLQCSICNNYKSGNERNYDNGLNKHYGIVPLCKISDLRRSYQSLKLSINDLKEVREKAKAIKKRLLNGEDLTRDYINEYLGIYNT